MLPCARGCLGKKVNPLPAARADSQGREPLLFLYPRWFQDTVRNSSAIRSASRRKCSTTASVNPPIDAATRRAYEDHETVQTYDKQDYPCQTVVKRHKKFVESCATTEAAKARLPASWNKLHWKLYDSSASKSAIKEKQDNNSQQLRRLDTLALARQLATLQQTESESGDELVVDASFLVWYTGTSEENIWRHHDGSGCVVHATVPALGSSCRRVTFSGTPRAREIAVQHLKHLQVVYRKELKQKQDNHEEVPEIEQANEAPVDPYVRVDQLPRPEVWSLRTFYEHVGAIIGTQAPRGVERLLYPKEDTRNKTVAKVLLELFDDPVLRLYQSSAALRKVLEFCSTRTDIAYAARQIWGIIKHNDIVPDIACFNLSISRSIRVGDGASIRRLFKQMSRSRIQPNSATWACLFKALKSQHEQTEFLKLSGIRSTAHDRTSKEIFVQALVDTTFHPVGEDLIAVSMFEERMRMSFGDDWLTPAVVQRMIKRCAEVLAFRTISKVLELANKHSIKFDTESFTALLEATTKTEWFEDTLLLLRANPRPPNTTLDPAQIELIFRKAWRQRLPNTARVLWHYAASHGSISHNMLTKISRNLTNHASSEVATSSPVSPTMAAVIVSPEKTRAFTSANNDLYRLDSEMLDVFAGITQWTSAGEARHNQLQLAHLFLEQELRAWQRFEPMMYDKMLRLLQEAYTMDCVWQNQGFLSTLPLQDLVRRMIQVDLLPLPTTECETSQTSTTEKVDESSKVLASKQDPICVGNHNQTFEEAAKTMSSNRNIYNPTDENIRTSALEFHAMRNLPASHAAGGTNISLTASMHIPLIDYLLHYLGLAWEDI